MKPQKRYTRREQLRKERANSALHNSRTAPHASPMPPASSHKNIPTPSAFTASKTAAQQDQTRPINDDKGRPRRKNRKPNYTIQDLKSLPEIRSQRQQTPRFNSSSQRAGDNSVLAESWITLRAQLDKELQKEFLSDEQLFLLKRKQATPKHGDAKQKHRMGERPYITTDFAGVPVSKVERSRPKQPLPAQTDQAAPKRAPNPTPTQSKTAPRRTSTAKHRRQVSQQLAPMPTKQPPQPKKYTKPPAARLTSNSQTQQISKGRHYSGTRLAKRHVKASQPVKTHPQPTLKAVNTTAQPVSKPVALPRQVTFGVGILLSLTALIFISYLLLTNRTEGSAQILDPIPTIEIVSPHPSTSASPDPNDQTAALSPAQEETPQPLENLLAVPESNEIPSGVRIDTIPKFISGKSTVVQGHQDPSSKGPVRTYRVEIEDGLDVDGEVFARSVHMILNDPRGWPFGFERVDGDAEFIIVLATPQFTNQLCYPLHTNDETNCRNGQRVVLNARRWAEGAKMWEMLGQTINDYRIYQVNHETGHFLGHGHEFCLTRGLVAPVMQQQSSPGGENRGCRPNGWPTLDNTKPE